MTNPIRRTFALLAFVAVLSCGAPAPFIAVSPAPTQEAVSIETWVAGTFSASATQTAVAAPPTFTPVPATLTPEPPKSSLSVQDDGSTLFADEGAGFKVVIPPGWLALRVDKPEYDEAWTLAVASDAAIQNALREIEKQDPERYRLFALDAQDGRVWGGFVTSVRFIWERELALSLENDIDLRARALQPDSAVEISRTASGVPFGAVTSKIPAKTADGMDMIVIQKQVYFNLKEGTLIVEFSTPESLSETTTPEFSALIESVVLTGE